MATSRALEDGHLILMAWEVVERRGWEFVIDTLLRGGIELFPADPSSEGLKGFWEGVGRDTQLSLFSPPTDCSTIMASREEEEKEKASLWDRLKVSSSGSGGQKSELNTSLVTPSLQEQSPVQSDCKLNLSIESKIKEFIAEATLSFSKYFSKTDLSAIAQDVVFTPSQDPPVQQVAMVPAMPASQTVAVTKPVQQLSPNMTLLPPLAAHICKDLQVTVISLKYFNMFCLLEGQRNEIFLSQTVLTKDKNKDFTISKWQENFAIMGSILLEHAPEKMKGFFNYWNTICLMHEKGTSKGWLKYDEEFRRLKERQPDLSWDTIHSGIWQRFCSQPTASAEPVTGYLGICWMYNNKYCKEESHCPYDHMCSICSGSHSKLCCPKLNPVSSGPPLKRTK